MAAQQRAATAFAPSGPMPLRLRPNSWTLLTVLPRIASHSMMVPSSRKLFRPTKILVTDASLTKILVGGNNIGGDGAQQLAAAVLAKPTLEVFSEIPLKELRADSLTSLDLTSKGLGVPEAIVLADLLRSVCASMTRLDVRVNSLGEEGKAALRKALEGRSGFELLL